MSATHDIHPLEMLTAALGGRRLYTLLWALWLFAAIVGHYAQDIARNEVIQFSTKIAFAVSVTGLMVYSLLLLRGLVSKERREGLISKQTEVPQVRISFRILVWIVPFAALGALLAPALVK